MDLQVIGVLLLTAGVFTVYGGVSGFNPLEVLRKIAGNPGEASSIIAESKTPLTGGSDAAVNPDGGTGSNPWSKYAVICGFQCHKSRNPPSQSPGIDFKMPVGTPVITPISGRLTNATFPAGYGNYVTITTKDGYSMHFGHLSAFKVKNNTVVTAGTIVGLSGGIPGAPGAGNSQGPHLHVDVTKPGGGHIDPLVFLAARPLAVLK